MVSGVTGIGLVARMCHEVNRAWCEINGDESQKPRARGWSTERIFTQPYRAPR